MKSRRALIQPFGLSFLDVLACALGAVVFLLMQTANRTHKQARIYDSTIANYKRQLGDLQGDVADARAGQRRADEARGAAEEERDTARGELERAKNDIGAANRARQDAVAAANRARADQREADQRAAAAEGAAQAAREQRDQALADLADARAQLENLSGVVGLKGKMKNVVFVFDTSESMQGDRFQEYKDLLGGWVEALEFETFSIISFNYNFYPWPENKELVEATPQARQQALEQIASWKAERSTNTLEALVQALSTEGVDTIVLLSDGQPNLSLEEPVASDPQTAAQRSFAERATQRVLRGVAGRNLDQNGNPKVTINTVAMGNYLNKQFGAFLQNLARQNGGEFIGR